MNGPAQEEVARPAYLCPEKNAAQIPEHGAQRSSIGWRNSPVYSRGRQHDCYFALSSGICAALFFFLASLGSYLEIRLVRDLRGEADEAAREEQHVDQVEDPEQCDVELPHPLLEQNFGGESGYIFGLSALSYLYNRIFEIIWVLISPFSQLGKSNAKSNCAPR